MTTVANGQAVAAQQQNGNGQGLVLQRINGLQTAINQDYVQNQLKAALSENASSFAATLIDIFTTDKNLQECDPKKIIMQAMKAAVLKLPINKNLGFGYIIAYKGVPEFQLGYKGLLQLALRTGQYRIINCDVVYEGEFQSANKLTGEFDLTGMAKSDTVVGYFAHFELKNGFSKTLYMSKERVQKHAAKYSKSYNNSSSPWKTEFDAMAKKTVLRNLLTHYGMMSVELADILDKEDVADTVAQEINQNANVRPLHFDKVDDAIVQEGAAATTTAPQQQTTITGPGF